MQICRFIHGALYGLPVFRAWGGFGYRLCFTDTFSAFMLGGETRDAFQEKHEADLREMWIGKWNSLIFRRALWVSSSGAEKNC